MATIQAALKVHFRWWLRPYVVLLKLFILATRRFPSERHINAVIKRAVIVKVSS